MDGIKESAAASLKETQVLVERYLRDPANHDILALIKAMRNGLVYGTKIRFPHALVMTFLFRTGPLSTKIRAILAATLKHATNLATFAFTYKFIFLILHAMPADIHSPKVSPARATETALPITTYHYRKESSLDSFFAGLVAGYITFGRPGQGKSAVNQQIVIYVFARVCLGLAKLAVQPRRSSPSGFQAGYSTVSPRGGGLLESLPIIGKNFSGEDGDRWRRAVQKGSWPVFASVSWAMVMWLFRWYPDVLQPSMRSSMRYLYEDCERWDGLSTWLWRNE